MSQPQKSIDVADLDLNQLNDVKKQLEEELQHLTSSYSQLKTAHTRFRDCIDSVKTLEPSNQDKPILVPLTESLYVPGKLSDVKNVVVDVGTGYYVEKNVKDATAFYSRKVDFVKTNLDKIQSSIEQKQNNLRGLYLPLYHHR